MTRRPGAVIPCAWLLALTAAAIACRPAPEVQLAAAVSLRDPLADLLEESGDVRSHLAASGVLVRQALEGAPFDVIVVAGSEEMDRLDQAGRIRSSTRAVVATNRLVLGVPAWDEPIASLEELAAPRISRIALGSPSTVPLGRYASQVLEGAGLLPELQPKLIYAGHARQVLQYLERGEVDAGFLYRSDAVSTAGVQSCVEIPAAAHDPIRYEAAVLSDASAPERARNLVDRLAGPRGAVAFRRHGFGPPG